MKTVVVAALLLSAASLRSAADAPGRTETKHLTVTTSAARAPAGAGPRVTLAVDVAPKTKMHVYAPGQDGYITVTLTLDDDPAFSAAKAKYPAPEKIQLPALPETQLVYARPFRIVQEVTLRPDARRTARAADPSTLTIKGTLRYQACDDTICYLPTTVPLTWTVARDGVK